MGRTETTGTTKTTSATSGGGTKSTSATSGGATRTTGAAGASGAAQAGGAAAPAGLITPEMLTVIPANQASWADLAAVFGSAEAGHCSCQAFKTRGRAWAEGTDEERRTRLREQANCGDPEATSTSGLVAYLTEGRVPVGWVAVEPRTEYPRLLGKSTVWRGRHEDKDDSGVWSVTCFVVRKGYRRRGVTYGLAAASVGYARDQGARALEGYAMRTQPGREITWGELYVGAAQVFADAGFTEVSAPSVRRVVMRVDFSG